jgi:hypothetical protein
MRKFGGYDFVANGVLGDHRDIQSIAKQKTTKIDSFLLTFIQMIKVKLFAFNLSSPIYYKQQKVQVPNVSTGW